VDTAELSPLSAALRLGAALGLDPSEPVVLADRSNLVVHLAPAPVVARVATRTAQARPDVERWLAREVAVTRHLAGLDAAVVTPCSRVDPGPHHIGGRWVTLWDHAQHDPSAMLDPVELGRSLGQLHQALATYEGDLPYLPVALDEVATGIDEIQRDGAVRTSELSALRDELERLTPELRGPTSAVQPLHGDAHARNVLATADGPRWVDFEDASTGPVTWDLACLTRLHPARRDEILAAHGGGFDAADLAPFLDARDLQARVWRLRTAAWPRGT
jgi:aminoglycoside phosphotransferase (APT) family kinase protein